MQANNLSEVLSKCEWAATRRDDVGHNDYSTSSVCPVCGGYKPGSYAPIGSIGHRPECPLPGLIAIAGNKKQADSPQVASPTPRDLVNLRDDGEAAFDITDVASGAAISADDLLAFIREEDAEEANKRYQFRCRRCGSSNCEVDDDICMGSSWTGLYGSMDLVCRACDASLELYAP